MKLSRVKVFLVGSVTILVIIFLPFITNGQPTGGGPGGTPPPVPISGIELLLAGGAAFGAKKIYDMTRRKK
jgi:hypothetical protein